MFKTPLPLRYRTIQVGEGDCYLCSEPHAPTRVYEALHGPLQDGWVVEHKGTHDVPTCVNPLHIMAVKTPKVGRPLSPKGVPDKPIKPPKALHPKAVPLEWNGVTVSAVSVATEYGVSRTLMHQRIAEGWGVREAVTTPPLGRGKRRT